MNLLRLGLLSEGYIAPVELLELRELVRHRRQVTQTAPSVTAQIRALLAKHGIGLPAALESQSGQDQLDAVRLPDYAAGRPEPRRRLMLLDNEIDALDVELDRRLKTYPGYRNLLTVRGIGPALAASFVVEIGDVSRFNTADQLACWAGLTPRHYGSDLEVRRRHSARKAVRWCGEQRSRWCSGSGALSWPTRSIFTNPRRRVVPLRPRPDLVAALSSDPSLVWLRLRSTVAARAGASRRSIVAGDIATRACLAS